MTDIQQSIVNDDNEKNEKVNTKHRKGVLGEQLSNPTVRTLLVFSLILGVIITTLISVKIKKDMDKKEESKLATLVISPEDELNESQRTYIEGRENEENANDADEFGSSTLSFSQNGINLLNGGYLTNIPDDDKLKMRILDKPENYSEVVIKDTGETFIFDRKTKSLFNTQGVVIGFEQRQEILNKEHELREIDVNDGRFSISYETQKAIDKTNAKLAEQNGNNVFFNIESNDTNYQGDAFAVDESKLAQYQQQNVATSTSANNTAMYQNEHNHSHEHGNYGGNGDGGGYNGGDGGGAYVGSDLQEQSDYGRFPSTYNYVQPMQAVQPLTQNPDGSVTATAMIPTNPMGVTNYENAKRQQLMNNLEEAYHQRKLEHAQKTREMILNQKAGVSENINSTIMAIDNRYKAQGGFMTFYYPSIPEVMTTNVKHQHIGRVNPLSTEVENRDLLPRNIIRKGTKWRVIVTKTVDTAQGDMTVTARLIDGAFAGSTVWGEIQIDKDKNQNNIGIEWNTIIPKNPRLPTLDITARALSLGKNYGSTGVATEVNHHYLRNYTGAVLESAIEGYGNAYDKNTGATTISSANGTTITVNNQKVSREEIEGSIAKSLSEKIKSDISRIGNRPTTFKIAIGTPLELELLQDLNTETASQNTDK